MTFVFETASVSHYEYEQANECTFPSFYTYRAAYSKAVKEREYDD